jgi:hypothetical protein
MEVLVAKKKTLPERKGRLELVGPQEWFARVKAQAERLGLSSTGYIKQAVTRQLESDEATDPARKRGDDQ